jgi:predicted acylesterase/phospholipase RssA
MQSNATGYNYDKINLIYQIGNVNMVENNNSNSNSSEVHRALIFQGGGSLGAYGAGAYKAINEELSVFIKKRQDREKEEPILFHIVSGTSIGAINAAILVSYVKENRTWEGSGQRLIDFWEYLSTRSYVEDMNPYFTEQLKIQTFQKTIRLTYQTGEMLYSLKRGF